MNKKSINFYKSTDLSLTALLQLYKYEIFKTERDNSGKITFFIVKDERLDKIVKSFWSRNIRVCPLSYFESLRNAKSLIYQK